jgi:hypothetical protein
MSIKRLGYLGAGETHGALRTSHADLVLVAQILDIGLESLLEGFGSDQLVDRREGRVDLLISRVDDLAVGRNDLVTALTRAFSITPVAFVAAACRWAARSLAVAALRLANSGSSWNLFQNLR